MPTAGAFDPDDALVTRWTAPEGGPVDRGYTLRVEVFDSLGHHGSATVVMTVRAAGEPVPVAEAAGASVFDPRVLDGWRDPELPIATPGVVLSFIVDAKLSGSTLTLIDNANRIVWQRMPPYYVTGSESVYLRELRISDRRIDLRLGRSSIATSQADFSFNTTAFSSLVLIVQAGNGFTRRWRFQDLRRSDARAPYSWGVDAAELRAAIAESGEATKVALVDETAGNVIWSDSAVTDPTPRYIPLAPLATPASVFDEAVTPGWTDNSDATPGVVWRWTRRGAFGASGAAELVDAGNPNLPPATLRVPPEYTAGANTYLTGVTVAEGSLSLALSDYWTRTAGTVGLDVSRLYAALRASDGATVAFSLADGQAEDDPFTWEVDALTATFVTALREGTADIVLLDPDHPNVDVQDLQVERTSEGTVIDLFAVAREVLRTRAALTVARTDGVLSLEARTLERIALAGGLTVTPFAGERPAVAPLSVEVRERATEGRFRGRRWADRTGEVRSVRWTRSLGQIGSIDAELPPRRRPALEYSAQAPDYLDRGVDARLVGDDNVGVIFPALSPARSVDVEDRVVLSDVDVVPAAPLETVGFRVKAVADRGGQRYSVFDHGTPSDVDLAGLRGRFSGALGSGGALDLKGCVITLGVVVHQATFLPASVALHVSGAGGAVRTFRSSLTVLFRHDASGDTWLVEANAGELQDGDLVIAIPEESQTPASGVPLGERLSEGEPFTLVLAERESTRIDFRRREVDLQQGDSVFDLVLPAAADSALFAGLLDRTHVETRSKAAPIVLSDETQRLALLTADEDVFVSRLEYTAAGLRATVQNHDGHAVQLPRRYLARWAVALLHPDSGTVLRFPFSAAAVAGGVYTWSGPDAARIAAVASADPDPDVSFTVAVIDTGFYGLAGEALAGTHGDFFELELEPPLPARQTTSRYQVTLTDTNPQVGHAESQRTSPWVPLDGSEVRTVISRWPPIEVPISIPAPGIVRLDTSRVEVPPMGLADSVVMVSGVELLDGSDPLDTPLPVSRIREHSIDLEADATLTGTPGRFQRASDRLPNFGGWLIEPADGYLSHELRGVTVSGQDYSAVTDRRLNYGSRLVSREGETVGALMARMLEKWQTETAGEDLGDQVDTSLGGVLDPPFDDEAAGGVRASWRAVLDAIQARSQGDGIWEVTPERNLRWRRPAVYTGLTLVEGDYADINIVPDRQRARNVVDVRSEVDRSLLVADESDIAARARVEGGSGRYEIVSDSYEGVDPGEAIAEQHGRDQLARYPFLYRITLGVDENVGQQLDALQRTALLRLLPGDLVLVGGAHLPDLPRVTVAGIGPDTYYVEPAAAAAVPEDVQAGKFVSLNGGPALEVLGVGGPRGSFWIESSAGLMGEFTARLVEHWLVTDIEIYADVARGSIRSWSLRGIRPRVEGARARAQNGVYGLLRETLAGIGR